MPRDLQDAMASRSVTLRRSFFWCLRQCMVCGTLLEASVIIFRIFFSCSLIFRLSHDDGSSSGQLFSHDFAYGSEVNATRSIEDGFSCLLRCQNSSPRRNLPLKVVVECERVSRALSGRTKLEDVTDSSPVMVHSHRFPASPWLGTHRRFDGQLMEWRMEF